MQGRLLESPVKNDLDWFPTKTWKREFSLAKELPIKTIELVLDRKMDRNNPLRSDKGRKEVKQEFLKNKLQPYSCCMNFIIDHPISDEDIFKDIKKLIIELNEIGVKNIILPLFNASSLSLPDTLVYIKKLIEVAESNNIYLLIETDKSGKETLKYLSKVASQNIGIVYDIGNATYLGHDIGEDVALLEKKIKHIHIKDKNKNGKNVKLGKGICDFNFFFQQPNIQKYSGFFTLETSRGGDPIKRAIENLDFIQELIKKK